MKCLLIPQYDFNLFPHLRTPAATMLFLASPREVRLELWLRPMAMSSAPALPI